MKKTTFLLLNFLIAFCLSSQTYTDMPTTGNLKKNYNEIVYFSCQVYESGGTIGWNYEFSFTNCNQIVNNALIAEGSYTGAGPDARFNLKLTKPNVEAKVTLKWYKNNVLKSTKSWTITVGSDIPTPTIQMSGPTTMNVNGEGTFTANYSAHSSSSNYNWTVSNKLSIVSGQGTKSIRVKAVSAGSATLTVKVDNISKTYNTTIKAIDPPVISGPYNILYGQKGTFTASNIHPNAKNLQWTVSGNAKIGLIVSEGSTSKVTITPINSSCGNITLNFSETVDGQVISASPRSAQVNMYEVVSIDGPTSFKLKDITVFGDCTASPAQLGEGCKYEWRLIDAGNTGGGYVMPRGNTARVSFTKGGIYYVECRAVTPCGPQSSWRRHRISVTGMIIDYVQYDSSNKQLIIQPIDKSEKGNSFYQITNLTTGNIVDKGYVYNTGKNINVNGLPKGIYVVTLQIDPENTITNKFVIN